MLLLRLKSNSASRSKKKQNVARLPSGRLNRWLLSPKLSVRRNWDTSRCEKGKIQRLGSLSRLRRKQTRKDINAEDFLPSGVTPQKALQMLKDMIQKRSGRWLVTPVLEEDGCLVTSDKAFDMIAGENIGISKHILCGMLSRAQRRPLLKKRQGKLYLEVNET